MRASRCSRTMLGSRRSTHGHRQRVPLPQGTGDRRFFPCRCMSHCTGACVFDLCCSLCYSIVRSLLSLATCHLVGNRTNDRFDRFWQTVRQVWWVSLPSPPLTSPQADARERVLKTASLQPSLPTCGGSKYYALSRTTTQGCWVLSKPLSFHSFACCELKLLKFTLK